MSLRRRLVATIAAYVAVGLFVALGATFGAVIDATGESPISPAELRQRVLTSSVVTAAVVIVASIVTATFVVRRGLRPLDDITRVADAVGLGDLDQRIRSTSADTELGRIAARINDMLDRLQQAVLRSRAGDERRRRFLADAAHELRSPLVSIRGYAELFRRGAATRPEDLALAMTRIESEAARMGRMVEDMLRLARLDDPDLSEPRRPVDLAALLDDAVADFRARYPDRPIHDGTERRPVLVEGDPADLVHLVTNLLTNAATHTPDGTEVTVRTWTAGDRACLEVHDSGPGIPAAERERVFDRFFRGSTRPPEDHRGSGLGLAIAATVAERLGGALRLASGPGTRFVAEFPALAADP